MVKRIGKAVELQTPTAPRVTLTKPPDASSNPEQVKINVEDADKKVCFTLHDKYLTYLILI